MSCRVCDEDVETRNIDLYVTGSEGLNICNTCEMLVVTYVRNLISLAGRSRKHGYLKCRDARDANARWLVKGDHPVGKRPDKVFDGKGAHTRARDYANELHEQGCYENVTCERMEEPQA